MPINIPFLDFGAMHAELQPRLDAAFARVVDSNRISLVKQVITF